MKSKFTEAFDSLASGEETKRERAQRVMSSYDGDRVQSAERGAGECAVAVKKPLFSGKRGIALIVAIALFVTAAAVAVPVGIVVRGPGGMLGTLERLKDTYVDMTGIAAFGIWNAPDSVSESAHISDFSPVVTSSQVDADDGEESDDPAEDEDEVITGDWSDEERYDWESDYDWDPTKANVLVSFDDEGKIGEVVYERTNGRGQVRQDTLGNAVAVYVSDSFTYVMYISDEAMKFWSDMSYMTAALSPFAFACHHERAQTVVIHNETGKVFALNDLIPQVSELSGELNHTMQVEPFKHDYLYVRPMYGNLIPQWYNVIYDEKSETLRYELILPADSEKVQSYTLGYNVTAVRRDKYGQQYLLEGCGYEGIAYEPPRVQAGIVELPEYEIYGNVLVLAETNGIMTGTDGRMYAFDDGKLKVFGEDFELRSVEPGTSVAFEGICADFGGRHSMVGDGIVYMLEGEYLYSMFGEVWSVGSDGMLSAIGHLDGTFPRYADDCYIIGDDIIAYVNTELTDDGRASVNGEIVRMTFGYVDGVHSAASEHLIDATQISVFKGRMEILQCDGGAPYQGNTDYFLLMPDENGDVEPIRFAYGYGGQMLGVTRPIAEPVILPN